MDTKVNLGEFFKAIFKKWPVLLVLIIAGAVIFNCYGANKHNSSADAMALSYEDYCKAAPALPSYFTPELYSLRQALSENDAYYVQAVAGIFRNFMFKYGSDLDLLAPGALDAMGEDENLLPYVTFIGSFKDIKAAMSNNQQAYFTALINLPKDIDVKAVGADVPEADVSSGSSSVYPVWVLVGAFAGFALGFVVLAVSYLSRKH